MSDFAKITITVEPAGDLQPGALAISSHYVHDGLEYGNTRYHRDHITKCLALTRDVTEVWADAYASMIKLRGPK